jgi:myo-inositol-1(or 4)-monophosphatase
MDKLKAGVKPSAIEPRSDETGAVDLDLAAVTRIARDLAVEQGGHILAQWPSIGPLNYKDRRDMATNVDVEVERTIKGKLGAMFPDHGFQGEETADRNPGADYQWLVDPIDGTKYYVGQSSLFSVSIALLHRGQPVVGVVYNVTARQCFHAYRGGGSFLDGQRLGGPTVDRLNEVIANVDTPKTHRLPPEERLWFETKLVELSRRLYRLRALGVGSLAACWLASGALDAYVDLTGYVKPQDTAAGRVLLSEAGVQTEYLDVGVGPRRLLAAPPQVFEELRDILLRT